MSMIASVMRKKLVHSNNIKHFLQKIVNRVGLFLFKAVGAITRDDKTKKCLNFRKN